MVYVDDLTIMGNSLALIIKLKEALAGIFNLKDMGALALYLNIRVTRDRGSRLIYIDQELYIQSVLEKFGYADANPVRTPLNSGTTLEKNEEDPSVCDPSLRHHYQSILGSLMYAMLGTRPDIAFAVSRLCQFQSNPTSQHLHAAQHILRYLRGTSHYRLCLGPDSERGDNVVGYTDADFAGDVDTSRSTSGWCFFLGRGTTAWESRKQQSVSRSTFESEYHAASEACVQVLWLINFTQQIDHPASLPITLYCDNKSAIDTASKPNVKRRTKHIRVSAHYVHDCVERGEVQLVKIPGVDNPADILTKALTHEAHAKHTANLGLVPYPSAKGEC